MGTLLEGVQSYAVLFGEMAFDPNTGDTMSAYKLFAADAANLSTTADLCDHAGQNDNLQAYFFMDGRGLLHILHNFFNVRVGIVANTSAHAGHTVAMIDELRELSRATWVRIIDQHFNRVMAAYAPTVAHMDALLATAGAALAVLVPEKGARDGNYDHLTVWHIQSGPNRLAPFVLTNLGVTLRQAFEVLGGDIQNFANLGRDEPFMNWLRVAMAQGAHGLSRVVRVAPTPIIPDAGFDWQVTLQLRAQMLGVFDPRVMSAVQQAPLVQAVNMLQNTMMQLLQQNTAAVQAA